MTDELSAEIAEIENAQARAALEAKWRPALARRLRQLADRIEQGASWVELYFYDDEDGIDMAAETDFGKAVTEVVQWFDASESVGDEWGVVVPVQRRAKRAETL